MRLIEKTEKWEIYLDAYEGIPVRIKKDLRTNEISFFAEDVAKVLDYGSVENMMQDNSVLDIMNEEHKRTGNFPVSVVRLD